MSVLDGGFDPVYRPTLKPDLYPPERPQPPTGMENFISCVVGGHWIPRDDAAVDFGEDVWRQPWNRGWCREHWDGRPSASGGMDPADDLGPER